MTTIIEQLAELVESGDEKEVRTFIIEHINEFPLDVKNDFIFAFLKEAIGLDTKIKELQCQIVEEGASVLKEIRKDKSNLLDKQKILMILEKIKK